MNASLSLTKKIIASNFKRLNTPYKLTYAITYWCNSRCELCSIWKKPIKQELTTAQIRTFFETNRYFNWIHLTGGEIFLRPDALEIMTTIIETQPELYLLNMPTNGLLPERIYKTTKAMLAHNPKHCMISISLDGPEAIHDKLRGITGGWKKAVQTYKLLSTLKTKTFSCYFGITVSGHNQKLLEQTYRALKKEIPNLKRSEIHLNIAHVSSHYYGNTEKQLGMNTAVADDIQAFIKKTPRALNPVGFLERIYQNQITHYLQAKKTPMLCKALASSVFLNPYGILFPCSMWNYPLGNIKDYEYDIRKIWNASQTIRALKIIMEKKCPHCWTPCEAYQTILGNLSKAIPSIIS